MKIRLNGESLETAASTVENLLIELDFLPTQVAVEYNGAVLFRQELPQTRLCEGDQIEIVRVAAGG